MSNNSLFRRGLRLLGAGLVLAAAGGCVMVGDYLDQARWRFGQIPFYVFDNAKGYREPAQPKFMEEPVTLVIAVSGGGTRSAVFTAGVFEQLARIPDPRKPGRSVLEGANALSAVSGGAVAATYYSLYKPDSLSDPAQATAFFQLFKSHMSLDIFARGWTNYLSHPWEAAGRYYLKFRFAQSLASTLDHQLFKNATFADLDRREASGQSPAVIISAVSLDTGCKFLFTNLNASRNFRVEPENLLGRLPSVVPPNDLQGMKMVGQTFSSPISRSFGFDDIDSDICQFRLSHALAASMAQPMVPGPVVLVDYARVGYVHLADGGLNDNFGIDAAVEAYLTKLQDTGKRRKLVIVSLDATAREDTDDKSGDPDSHKGAIAFGKRAFITATARGQNYSHVMLSNLDSIRLVTLRLNSIPGTERLETLGQGACISEKDMYIVLDAACKVVQAQREAIVKALSN